MLRRQSGTAEWEPVYRPAESPYTRSGRVLNPRPGGYYATKDHRTAGSAYRDRDACQRYCDQLNAADQHTKENA